MRLLRGIGGLVLVLTSAAACSSTPASDGRPDGADGVGPLMTGAAATTDCGSAPTTVKEHLRSDKIVSVTVVGQCTLVVIETALDDSDGATAKQICESAAEVAYTGDINGITVKSQAGTELSQGITGMKCLP